MFRECSSMGCQREVYVDEGKVEQFTAFLYVVRVDLGPVSATQRGHG